MFILSSFEFLTYISEFQDLGSKCELLPGHHQPARAGLERERQRSGTRGPEVSPKVRGDSDQVVPDAGERRREVDQPPEAHVSLLPGDCLQPELQDQ